MIISEAFQAVRLLSLRIQSHAGNNRYFAARQPMETKTVIVYGLQEGNVEAEEV